MQSLVFISDSGFKHEFSSIFMTELGQEYAGENSDGSIELNNELLRNRSFLRATKHGNFFISAKYVVSVPIQNYFITSNKIAFL